MGTTFTAVATSSALAELVDGARVRLSSSYRHGGVDISPNAIVETSLNSTLKSPEGEEASRRCGWTFQFTHKHLRTELEHLGVLERDTQGASVLTPAFKWSVLTDPDATPAANFAAAGVDAKAPAWKRNALERELRALAAAGADSDQPVRALAYAAEAVTGSAQAALAVVTALAHVVDPRAATRVLLSLEPRTAAVAAVKVVVGILDQPPQ